MAAKKRWLNMYHDYHELHKTTQPSISWSSSESEDEFNKYIRFKKKKKVSLRNDVYCKPMNETHKEIYEVDFTIPSTSNYRRPISISNGLSTKLVSKKAFSPITKHTSDNFIPLKKRYYVQDTQSNKLKSNYFSDSNDMNNFVVDEMSPILNRNRDIKENNGSPILGKMSYLRRIRLRYKQKMNIMKESCVQLTLSPDLFTQSTQFIEHDSPDLYDKHNLSITDFNGTEFSEHNIDPFPSQCTSQINDFNTDNSSERASDETNDSFLYHQPVPKKKKFKKGGLASILQKTLHLQKTRVSIWQHEVYTKKIDFVDNNKEIIEFIIRKEWKEYGNMLLECEKLSELNIIDGVFSSESTSNEGNIFLFIVGINTPLNITYQVGYKYKLFPPYSIKYITYKSKSMLCCFNVTKVTFSEKT